MNWFERIVARAAAYWNSTTRFWNDTQIGWNATETDGWEFKNSNSWFNRN